MSGKKEVYECWECGEANDNDYSPCVFYCSGDQLPTSPFCCPLQQKKLIKADWREVEEKGINKIAHEIIDFLSGKFHEIADIYLKEND